MNSSAPNLIVHVVDDDAAVRDSLAELLNSVLFEVKTYASAVIFLDQGVAQLSGCLVTDVEMPEMSGIDLLKHLRASPSASASTLPAIVMSGRAGDAMRSEALSNGASAFIEKPFDDDAVLAAVRSAFLSAGHADPLA